MFYILNITSILTLIGFDNMKDTQNREFWWSKQDMQIIRKAWADMRNKNNSLCLTYLSNKRKGIIRKR
jgi:hypothetical protein